MLTAIALFEIGTPDIIVDVNCPSHLLIVYTPFTIHGDNPPMMDFISNACSSSKTLHTSTSSSRWRTVSQRCCNRLESRMNTPPPPPSLYRLDIPIPALEYRYGWYGNLHRTQKHGFRLHHCAAHKGLRSTACGAHRMRFFLSYRCDDVPLCK